MVMEDEAIQCAMEAANGIKEEGTEVMPTATPDPPETGGVVAKSRPASYFPPPWTGSEIQVPWE